jgi:hypothetical protein
MCLTEMGSTLGAILVNRMVYSSGPLKWVNIWVQFSRIRSDIILAHQNGWVFGCNFGELDGVS